MPGRDENLGFKRMILLAETTHHVLPKILGPYLDARKAAENSRLLSWRPEMGRPFCFTIENRIKSLKGNTAFPTSRLFDMMVGNSHVGEDEDRGSMLFFC